MASVHSHWETPCKGLGEKACRFALGTRAPQVSGVKVVRSAATGGADADDVALDVDFVWGGNPVRALLPDQAQGCTILPPCTHCALCASVTVFLTWRHLGLSESSALHMRVEAQQCCT